MIVEATLQSRIAEMGAALNASLKGKNPLFISVLNGAFVFAADLIRHFEGDCEIAFVRLASYSGTQSSGQVKTVVGLDHKLKDRHLVVVEDIVDTGRTLHYFLEELRAQEPASIQTVALLRKPDALQFDLPVEQVGFDIGDRFVVGYGLDYNGLGRNLPEIYCLASN